MLCLYASIRKGSLNYMSLLQQMSAYRKRLAISPIEIRRQTVVLGSLLLLAIGLNAGFLVLPALIPNYHDAIVLCYIASFIPYLVACFIVLRTRKQEGSKLELGLILTGAVVLRVMLLQRDPMLSPDSWRYLWDARITLLGYSPYVYTPQDPLFAHLHDIIYEHTRYRFAPTIYPPGAQAFYLLSYVIAPSNLVVLKSIFVLMDLATCGALVYLLKRRGLDQRRVILYAWCPLPIVEFAIQGHLDAIAILFSLLAVVSHLSTRRGSRVLTGFLVGMATLAKLYPIILLVVVIRRRDWGLLATCFATIFLGYLPYLLLGHGQVFGFFATYAGQQQVDAGPALHIVTTLSPLFGIPVAVHGVTTTIVVMIEYAVDLLVVLSTALIVLVLRQRGSMSEEAGMLILIGSIFFVSSHIYPWYSAALLPWIAVLIQPLWIRGKGLNPVGIAIAMAWYFTCGSILHYVFDEFADWMLYYIVLYDVVLIGLGLAAIVAIRRKRARRLLPAP